MTDDLKVLGEGTVGYQYDAPSADILERFASPFDQETISGSVHIEVPEFTSLCPITGQPDFATIVIDYVPNEWCVESKSLKLYMFAFRNHGDFHEACVNRIANDLVEMLQCRSIKVVGKFTPRGGIPFWPTVEWSE
jgi:7-cyano-7-deazaguanine reductase